MGINKVMQNALRTNWTMTDDFMFTFINNQRQLEVNNNNGITIDDVFDMAVIGIDLPQLGSDVEAVMMGGEWRIYNVKHQPFTFSIVFRDFGSLDLRNYFAAVWMDAQRGYYEDVKSTVMISINKNLVFMSDDCLVTAVSQVQLNNNDSQVAEFTVEFSSPYYSNSEINKFGSDDYKNSVEGTLGSGGTWGNLISKVAEADSILGNLGSIIDKFSSF